MNRHKSITTRETITTWIRALNTAFSTGDAETMKEDTAQLTRFKVIPQFNGTEFFVTEEVLKTFDTNLEAEARVRLDGINAAELAKSRSRAQRSIDSYDIEIGRHKVWFDLNGFTITNASLTTGHQIPNWTVPYEKDLEMEAESRAYYLQEEVKNLQADRQELVRRLKTEIRSMEEIIDLAEHQSEAHPRGQWDRVYFSGLRSSNHDDIMQLATRIENRTQFLRNIRLVDKSF